MYMYVEIGLKNFVVCVGMLSDSVPQLPTALSNPNTVKLVCNGYHEMKDNWP